MLFALLAVLLIASVLLYRRELGQFVAVMLFMLLLAFVSPANAQNNLALLIDDPSPPAEAPQALAKNNLSILLGGVGVITEAPKDVPAREKVAPKATDEQLEETRALVRERHETAVSTSSATTATACDCSSGDCSSGACAANGCANGQCSVPAARHNHRANDGCSDGSCGQQMQMQFYQEQPVRMKRGGLFRGGRRMRGGGGGCASCG